MNNTRINFDAIKHSGQLYVHANWLYYQNPDRGLPILLQRTAALLGIVILSPLWLLLVIAIRMDSKGSAIYRQLRVGRHGQCFAFYKFRTMYCDDDPNYIKPDPKDSSRDGICLKFKNDPRITRIGGFLRRSSIDELPQLWNVLTGDMALVGPRPALAQEVAQYSLAQMDRLKVLPGITGIWQISGRADIPFEQQLEMDRQYIHSQSALADIKILLLTIPAVIQAKGAY
ncbi:sugar transferase [uncultured Pseudoteredinibacter sp.]|uniref:sugar transferase n=1 Tax=uncultured Pseudoteredinibacter sp. TaxID=1641701 RepID=UPI0026394426|nr:sugar transferase [uncultured Pseudoteredinibacter sp.]